MKNYEEHQKIKAAISIFEKKWSGMIIKVLLEEDKSFSMIGKEILNISDRVLSQRLFELEKDGILKRYVYTGIPVKVKYGLTSKGKALSRVMNEMLFWADEYL